MSQCESESEPGTFQRQLTNILKQKPDLASQFMSAAMLVMQQEETPEQLMPDIVRAFGAAADAEQVAEWGLANVEEYVVAVQQWMPIVFKFVSGNLEEWSDLITADVSSLDMDGDGDVDEDDIELLSAQLLRSLTDVPMPKSASEYAAKHAGMAQAMIQMAVFTIVNMKQGDYSAALGPLMSAAFTQFTGDDEDDTALVDSMKALATRLINTLTKTFIRAKTAEVQEAIEHGKTCFKVIKKLLQSLKKKH